MWGPGLHPGVLSCSSVHPLCLLFCSKSQWNSRLACTLQPAVEESEGWAGVGLRGQQVHPCGDSRASTFAGKHSGRYVVPCSSESIKSEQFP